MTISQVMHYGYQLVLRPCMDISLVIKNLRHNGEPRSNTIVVFNLFHASLWKASLVSKGESKDAILQ